MAVFGSLAIPFWVGMLVSTRGSLPFSTFDALLVVFATVSVALSWKITWQARMLAEERATVVGTNLGAFLLRRRGGGWIATHMPRTRWNIVALLFPARGRGETVERALVDAARNMGHEVRVVP